MALPSRLFCDTSFFYACLDPNDSNHNRTEELTADAVASSATFVTTWDIVCVWLGYFFHLPYGAPLSRTAAASVDFAAAKAVRSNPLRVAGLTAAGALPGRRRLDNAERIFFRCWGVKSAP